MIRIFSLEIRWYAFIIVTAIIISLVMLNFLLKNEAELEMEFFLDFLIAALPLAIIGARLYYVVFNLDYYLAQPLKILAIKEGGLAVHGALLMGTAVLYYFCRQREKSFLKTLDYLAPLAAFSQAVGRWGNFINQEAYGKEVGASFYQYFPKFIKKQMYINAEYKEPTFLYESAANLILFSFLLILLKRGRRAEGEVFALYLFFYSFYRYFIEDLRTDSLLIAGFQAAQLISLILALLALVLFLYLRSNKNNKKSGN